MTGPVVAIYNPRASNGGAARRWPAIERVLESQFPELEVQPTHAPGHATELARAALEGGAELLITVGGDGTCNEVVNGFVVDGEIRYKHARVGVVAAGTGGDFLRHFGALEPEEQVVRMAGAAPRRVDVGLARFRSDDGEQIERAFVNMASVGISGLVDRFVNRSGRIFGNTAAYAAASLKAIFRYRNHRIRMRVDGGEWRELDLTLLCVGNGRFFGAGMRACPNAVVDDGWFDTILLAGFGKTMLVRALARVYGGRHVGFGGIEEARAKVIELESEDAADEVLIDLDGEQPGRLPLRIEVHPAALSVQIA